METIMRTSAATAVMLLAASATGASAAGVPAPAPQTAALAPHHAVYALTLAKARGGDVIGARGNMSYEVIDACDGW
ncbi:MAG: DUF1849 family protein, partial [Acetobacteraceae bacterium]|nr:DUF1849 family protein [Acetobacteraceae bacterium]